MKTQEEVVRQHAVGPISIYKIYQEGYQDRELDDWDAFRREAAKDFVCALLQDNLTSYSQPYEWFCKQAIELADELIKLLKEEQK